MLSDNDKLHDVSYIALESGVMIQRNKEYIHSYNTKLDNYTFPIYVARRDSRILTDDTQNTLV